MSNLNVEYIEWLMDPTVWHPKPEDYRSLLAYQTALANAFHTYQDTNGA